jgi:hypothetical protein
MRALEQRLAATQIKAKEAADLKKAVVREKPWLWAAAPSGTTEVA